VVQCQAVVAPLDCFKVSGHCCCNSYHLKSQLFPCVSFHISCKPKNSSGKTLNYEPFCSSRCTLLAHKFYTRLEKHLAPVCCHRTGILYDYRHICLLSLENVYKRYSLVSFCKNVDYFCNEVQCGCNQSRRNLSYSGKF
jgi:hypothetical protein